MTAGRILIIIGLLFSLLGAVFLGKGLILTDKQIDQLSGTYFDSNKFLKNSLKSNRNWALLGFILLGIGFILQVIGTMAAQNGK